MFKDEIDDDLLEINIAEALQSQIPSNYQVYNKKLGLLFYKSIYPNKDGCTVYEKNITQNKLAENELLKTKKLLD